MTEPIVLEDLVDDNLREFAFLCFGVFFDIYILDGVKTKLLNIMCKHYSDKVVSEIIKAQNPEYFNE